MQIKSIILSPMAWAYGRVYKMRRNLYNSGFFQSKELGRPVISIGNLTFGGAGKTPFTQWIAEYLNALEHSVMILMRGYKGKKEHSHGILKAEKKTHLDPLDFGDEALLLAQRLKKGSVVVGKNRSENYEFYEKDHACDVVLLDDGHQHLKIQRNLNIVLFDSLLPISHYKEAPLVYLREGLSALRDADVVILSRSDQASEVKREGIKEFLKPYVLSDCFFAEVGYGPLAFKDIYLNKVLSPEEIKGKKVVASSALASSESFFNQLEQLGAILIERKGFPDHHQFRQEEISELIEKAEKADAYLIFTEKDIVKIRHMIHHPRILYLEIKVNFIKGEEAFKKRLHEILDTIPHH